MLHISLFKNKTDNNPQPKELDNFDALAGLFREPRVSPDKDGPLWSPAHFDGRRAKANVKSVSCIVLDFDGITAEQANAISDAVEQWRGFMHTTHSHTPGSHICFRLALECTREMTPQEYDLVWAYLSEKTGNISDTNARDSSRMYYLPACKNVADYQYQEFGTFPVNVDEVVATNPVYTPRPSPKPKRSEFLLYTPDPPAPKPETGPIDLAPYRERLAKHFHPNVRRIARGEPMEHNSKEGARYSLVTSMSGYVGSTIFDCPLEGILEIVRPSIMALGARSKPRDPPFIDEFERAIRKIIITAKERAEQRLQNIELQKAVDRTLHAKMTGDTNTGPYTPEQIAEWAARQNCSPQEFQRRWIIRFGDGGNLVYMGDLGYTNTIVRDTSLPKALQDYCSRVPIATTVTNEKGLEKAVSVAELISKYGTSCDGWRGSFVEQHSRLDLSEGRPIYVEAICPMRTNEAVFDPEFQELLEYWDGGSGELMDWFAVFPDLSKPSALLYLDGEAQSGKTLIARGLAGLWSRDSVAFSLDELLTSEFQDGLMKCPLAFADENVKMTSDYFSRLRAFVGQRSLSINRKNIPRVEVHGSLRFLITANNDRVLETKDELTTADIEAVQRRIHYRKLPPDSKAFLSAILARHPGEEDYLNRRWIEERGIAKHCLWLSQNHHYKRTPIVGAGGDPYFAETIATSTGSAALVCQALVRIFSQQAMKLTSPDPWHHAGEGELLVNEEQLCREWQTLVPGSRIQAPTITQHLKNLSVSSEQVQFGKRKFNRLKVEMLARWSRRKNVGDPDVFLENANRKNQVVAAWKAGLK